MAPVNINLTIEQGSDYEASFTITNDDGSALNLTDYDAEAKLRKHYASTTAKTFVITFVNRVAGEIAVSMASTVTSTLSEGRHVYDIVLTSPTNTKSRVIQGNVLVNPGVTL